MEEHATRKQAMRKRFADEGRRKTVMLPEPVCSERRMEGDRDDSEDDRAVRKIRRAPTPRPPSLPHRSAEEEDESSSDASNFPFPQNPKEDKERVGAFCSLFRLLFKSSRRSPSHSKRSKRKGTQQSEDHRQEKRSTQGKREGQIHSDHESPPLCPNSSPTQPGLQTDSQGHQPPPFFPSSSPPQILIMPAPDPSPTHILSPDLRPALSPSSAFPGGMKKHDEDSEKLPIDPFQNETILKLFSSGSSASASTCPSYSCLLPLTGEGGGRGGLGQSVTDTDTERVSPPSTLLPSCSPHWHVAREGVAASGGEVGVSPCGGQRRDRERCGEVFCLSSSRQLEIERGLSDERHIDREISAVFSHPQTESDQHIDEQVWKVKEERKKEDGGVVRTYTEREGELASAPLTTVSRREKVEGTGACASSSVFCEEGRDEKDEEKGEDWVLLCSPKDETAEEGERREEEEEDEGSAEEERRSEDGEETVEMKDGEVDGEKEQEEEEEEEGSVQQQPICRMVSPLSGSSLEALGRRQTSSGRRKAVCFRDDIMGPVFGLNDVRFVESWKRLYRDMAVRGVQPGAQRPAESKRPPTTQPGFFFRRSEWRDREESDDDGERLEGHMFWRRGWNHRV
uniref:Uncharacterized protein n=1 Tax=Chromera velia CCMP2878 TaxID=1169474 RepID=A0A0G4I279_9ALVE|eukprot:Cvel_10332.t1-p1 / transcript=Cvel_10332.t1 / gene=Cvel_10332 / organism=Chromera_velia_CCMP2878 / gene_product=hypothetical protein / transcript_product=hypothetical protein / location=Cvel_scaffold620:65100-67658(-) / protein_length=624 / sequence_SO=supercontig / SO=protein_coding / is_pseudo=false